MQDPDRRVRILKAIQAVAPALKAPALAMPALLLTVMALVWLGDVLGASWRFDDGFHLDFAQHLSPWRYFFDPAITRAQSGVHLTPWNTLFYDINILLFGADARLHYLHLLAVLSVIAWLCYAIGRHHAPALPAFAGAVIFLIGAPTFQVANELMAAHYAYGLLFAATAWLAFCRYRAGGRASWLVLSALLYLVACASKEVFTPLPLLLFALPGPPLRRRVIEIAPFAAVAFFYLLWRFAVLGVVVGGYDQDPLSFSDRLARLAQLPRVLTASTSWLALRPLMLSAALVAAVTAVLIQGRRAALVLAAGLIGAALPLFVLAGISLIDAPSRYLFVPWFLLSLLFGFLVSKVPFGRLGQSLATIALIAVAASSTTVHRPASAAHARPSEALYSAIAELKPGEHILLPADTVYPLMYQLFAFAHAEITDSPYRRDLLVTSTARLCRALREGRRILAYDAERGHFGDVATDILWATAAALDARRRTCLDPDALSPQPLSVRVQFSGNFLIWRLRPAEGGGLELPHRRAAGLHSDPSERPLPARCAADDAALRPRWAGRKAQRLAHIGRRVPEGRRRGDVERNRPANGGDGRTSTLQR